MIKPNIQLNDNVSISYYSLVVAIAKRAREVANEAEIKGEILVEKPVDIAVDEFIDGKFQIVESSACSGKADCKKDDSCTDAVLESMLEREIQTDEFIL